MVTIVSGPDTKSTTNAGVFLGEEREKMGRGHRRLHALWGQVSGEILAPGADPAAPSTGPEPGAACSQRGSAGPSPVTGQLLSLPGPLFPQL